MFMIFKYYQELIDCNHSNSFPFHFLKNEITYYNNLYSTYL